MKIFITVIMMSLALCSNGQSDQRFIEVIGTGEIEVAPDLAKLIIELREYNKNGSVVSVESLEGELNKILTSLKIPADQLTADASGARQSGPVRPGAAMGKAKQLSLQLTDLAALEPLIGRLREAGIQSSVAEASLSDASKFVNEAMAESIEDARKKAGLLASAVNAKLGRVLQIRELDTDPMRSSGRSAASSAAGRGRPGNSANLEPVNVTYNVVVRFMID